MGGNPPPSTVTYIPSDDLESLFFIFLEFTIIYGGPKGQQVPKEERLFPTEYDMWTEAYATMDRVGLWSSGVVKHHFFLECPSYKVSEYFEVCYPILEEWRGAIGNALRHGNQVSHKEILEIINRGLNNIVRTAPMSTNIASSSAVTAAPEVQITESAGSSGASVVPAVPAPMVPTAPASVVPAAPTPSSAPQPNTQRRQSARIQKKQTETPSLTSGRSLGKRKKRSSLSP